ncbi:MAG: hypothetical protein V1915_05135 [Candidatus Bathyarchaeota archaeon]
MRDDREKKVESETVAEEELREKYKGDTKKIIDMIKAQCEPVVVTFKDPSKSEIDQPKLSEDLSSVRLTFPFIVDGSIYARLNLYFNLVLTRKGYDIGVKSEVYNDTDSKTYSTSTQIQAKETAIRDRIRDFLEGMEHTRKRREEKKRLMKLKFS